MCLFAQITTQPLGSFELYSCLNFKEILARNSNWLMNRKNFWLVFDECFLTMNLFAVNVKVPFHVKNVSVLE